MNLYPTPDPIKRYWIPGGIQGVRATLAIMVKLAHQGSSDPGVIARAEQITQSCPAQNIRCEINAVFNWVKSNIRYVRDPRRTEKINTAERTLRVGCGDCDEMAVLTSSLLEAVGNKTRFSALAFADGIYEHVVTQVRVGANQWLTLDPTVRIATVGWMPPGITRCMRAHV